MDGRNEDAARLEVCDRINRELSDADWRRVYGRATQKLRHIITRFGDDGGARLTVDYIAQLAVEARRDYRVYVEAVDAQDAVPRLRAAVGV